MTKSTGKQSIHRYMSFEDRFWLQVNKGLDDECWEWVGAKYNKEYGQIQVNGRPTLSHRASWILHFGEIPSDMFICHKCDNPSCVNPNHLFLGTNEDNIKDKVKKERQCRGESRPESKLNNDSVLKIRELWDTGNFTQSFLAKMFGISISVTCNVINKKAWVHVK